MLSGCERGELLRNQPGKPEAIGLSPSHLTFFQDNMLLSFQITTCGGTTNPVGMWSGSFRYPYVHFGVQDFSTGVTTCDLIKFDQVFRGWVDALTGEHGGLIVRNHPGKPEIMALSPRHFTFSGITFTSHFRS